MIVVSKVTVDSTNDITTTHMIRVARFRRTLITDGTSHDQRIRGVSKAIVEGTISIAIAYAKSVVKVRRTEPPIFCRAFKNNEK